MAKQRYRLMILSKTGTEWQGDKLYTKFRWNTHLVGTEAEMQEELLKVGFTKESPMGRVISEVDYIAGECSRPLYDPVR